MRLLKQAVVSDDTLIGSLYYYSHRKLFAGMVSVSWVISSLLSAKQNNKLGTDDMKILLGHYWRRWCCVGSAYLKQPVMLGQFRYTSLLRAMYRSMKWLCTGRWSGYVQVDEVYYILHGPGLKLEELWAQLRLNIKGKLVRSDLVVTLISAWKGNHV